MMFGFHNFYDLNSGAILALSHQPSLNTYHKHGIAICLNPHLHINLKLLHFYRYMVRVDHTSGNISVSYCGNLVWTLYYDKSQLHYQNLFIKI